MTLQVLVSTMHQTDHSLLKKMNIQTDAIIINQCDLNNVEEFEYSNHHIIWMSLNERGIGLSRNSAMMRATADIILFADDDVIYRDNYESDIVKAFESYGDAALLFFTFQSNDPVRPIVPVIKPIRVNRLNCLRYGAVRIAIRREKVLYHNIAFSLLFGGGAIYSAGEDNIFVTDCLKSGMHCYALPLSIGFLDDSQSTWFSGYCKKYYFDRGVLLGHIYGRMATAFSIPLNFRKRSMETFTFGEKQHYTMQGIKQYMEKCK